MIYLRAPFLEISEKFKLLKISLKNRPDFETIAL